MLLLFCSHRSDDLTWNAVEMLHGSAVAVWLPLESRNFCRDVEDDAMWSIEGVPAPVCFDSRG